MAKHNDLGALGEDVAERFLLVHGFTIHKRNIRYGKKEIDIVSERNGIVRVVEVKTVSEGSLVSPEDNLTKDKLQNISEALHIMATGEEFHGKRLQVDFIAVTVSEASRKARCRLVQNINISNLP